VTDSQACTVLVLNHVGRLAPRVQQELRTLVETGYKVTVLHWARGSASADATDRPWVVRRLDTSAPVGWLGAILYLPWLYSRLVLTLRRQDPDVIHLTHFLFLPLAPVARAAGVRVVYDSYEFHALDLALRFPDPTQPTIERLVRTMETTLVRTVDCVLTIDSVDDRLARRYRRVCDDVVVLFNVPRVTDEGMVSGGRCDTTTEPFRLVYVGGITVEKGTIRALEAVRALRADGYRVRLQFVGIVQGGDGWFRRAVREAGVADVTEHTPWLPYETMLDCIAEADVALALHQPTERFRRVSTGNGRKFFTYMAASLPIVGPAFGEVGRAVTEAECGLLVDTTDTRAVATAVERLLDSPDLRNELGARGRQAVESRFNWSSEKRKLITAYPQIVDAE